MWKLVNKKTGLEISIGDTLTTHRGERVKLIGLQPPTSPNSEGKIVCEDGNRRDNVYYAGVVGARFERTTQEPPIIEGEWKIEE